MTTLTLFARRCAFLMRRQSARPLLDGPVTQAERQATYPPAPWLTKPSEATDERVRNLISLLEGYFAKGGQHININCVSREQLVDAMAHPEKYPGLTIRVSGYAVHFHRLSREQQLEVINRQFHDSM